MEQEVVKLAEETFCCIFCLDLLSDPVTIPCGHSYCMSCITRFWDGERRLHSCPQCRKTFTLRPVLMKNTMLAALVEELKKTRPQAARPDHCYAGPGDVACDVCTGRKLKALRSCLVCLASYCKEHLQPHHESPAFQKHKLVEPSKDLQGNTQQRIQDREKDVKLLQQEVEAINRSANKAVEDSGKMFTELIHLLEKRRSDVKQQVRSQQETEVCQVKELQEKLQQEIAELKQLSHTEENIQGRLSSLSPLSTKLRPLRYFEDVTAAVSEVRGQLQNVLSEKWPNISLMVTDVDVLLSNCRAEPTTRAGFLKYARDVTIDPNTAHEYLALSEGNRKATFIYEGQTYSIHPDRFDIQLQLLSKESLTGRCYFEVEWEGDDLNVAVAYKHNVRAYDLDYVLFGYNDTSWSLRLGRDGHVFKYNSDEYDVPGPVSSRIGVYLDHSAGLLSFYSVSDTDVMTHLYRFQTSFTHPLHAGFGFSCNEEDYAEFCKLK